jgi:hypothetical protein
MTLKPAKVRGKSSSRGPEAPPKLSTEHWDSPAGFYALEIRQATLKEVVDPLIPTKNIPELSIAELYDLAAARLRVVPDDFQLAVMGFGLIDKQRALAEVRARTGLGKHIAILQIKVLEQLIRSAQNEISAARKP